MIRKFIPIVVMQILLGIMLGPSILGKIFPDVYHMLFPAASLPVLSGISLIAVILFGFLTGLHFDVEEIRGKGKSFSIVSLSSIAVPALLGALVGWWASSNPDFIGPQATPLTFILGIGIAVGVTALPVLSATLIDMGIINKPLGRMALGYATVNDGILWILVAILLSLAAAGSHGGGMGDVITTVVGFAVYLLAMIFVIRPFLQKISDRGVFTSHPRHWELVSILCMVFLSAFVTEVIGVHYLLGAFVFGAIIPKAVAHDIMGKIDPVMTIVLLPFFFMLTGLRTQFDLASSAIWFLFIIVSIVSSFGKIFGTAIPERYVAKSDWKKSMQLGGLMQCKGLMEVIVLNMLLQGGIITPLSFSAMILMAVATTAATKPIVLFFNRVFKGPSDIDLVEKPEPVVETTAHSHS